MDVLSLDLIRAASAGGDPPGSSPLERLRRWWRAFLEQPGAPGPGAAGPAPAPASVGPRAARNLLLGWTASQILLGLGLLAWVTMTMAIDAAIAPSVLDHTALEGETGGILVWTVFGLFGSMRSVHSRGVHFTFNLPFVGAAMVLGGPVAGAWVAFLSTIERRELESLPWYAILANHASMVIATVAGGLTVIVTQGAVGAATGDDKLALFASILLGGVVLELTASVITAVTVMLRDQMTPSGVLWMIVDDFGRVTLFEIGLIWVLTMAFTDVGWWAPLVVGVLVLAFVAGAAGGAGVDELGLVNRAELERRLARMVGGMRRGLLRGSTVACIEVCDLELVAVQHGQAVADRVLQVTADRLRELCPRKDDLLGRLERERVAAVFAGLVHEEAAIHKAEQIIDTLSRPIATAAGPVSVDVAVGLSVVRAWGGVPSETTLLRWAEQAMLVASSKVQGCGGWHLQASGEDPEPFRDERLDGGA